MGGIQEISIAVASAGMLVAATCYIFRVRYQIKLRLRKLWVEILCTHRTVAARLLRVCVQTFFIVISQ
jgi:hypothetical protein